MMKTNLSFYRKLKIILIIPAAPIITLEKKIDYPTKWTTDVLKQNLE